MHSIQLLFGYLFIFNVLFFIFDSIFFIFDFLLIFFIFDSIFFIFDIIFFFLSSTFYSFSSSTFFSSLKSNKTNVSNFIKNIFDGLEKRKYNQKYLRLTSIVHEVRMTVIKNTSGANEKIKFHCSYWLIRKTRKFSKTCSIKITILSTLMRLIDFSELAGN